MKILVANVGSTSYKCRLFDMDSETELARGGVDKVGSQNAEISYGNPKTNAEMKGAEPVADHCEAVEKINRRLCLPQTGAIRNLNELAAVGFKTVQAGELNGSVLLNTEVTNAMERYASLAPAHNPPYLKCIRYFREILPETPLVGVFEPGFHTGIPRYAKVIGVTHEWTQKHQVRKYGYHGASFRYVTESVIAKLGLPKDRVKIIACHLGGSSSVCAFQNGHSLDVSMSFTPQSGLVQSGRVGDIDPFVLPYIMEKKGITLQAALDELCKNGGLKGISGISGDMREIRTAAESGNVQAQLAIDKLVYDVVRYIGSYHVLMQGVDVIAFSGGIGFNDVKLRKAIIDRIAFLGIELDSARNAESTEGVKTRESSPIKVYCVNTNEEIVVARETKRVVTALKSK